MFATRSIVAARAGSVGLAALVALVALGASPGAAHADHVAEIVIEGNAKTTDATVRRIAELSLGQPWSAAALERARTKLDTAGLFKALHVSSEPLPTRVGHDQAVRVRIQVTDKHSWIVVPAYYNQPTNKGGGVGFADNNFLGENKKLLLYAQYATGDSFFVAAFVDPAIRGSRFRWQLDTIFKSSRVIEYAAPTTWRGDQAALRVSRLNYLNTGLRLGLDVDGVSFDTRVRAAKVSYDDVGLASPELDPALVTGDPAITTIPDPGPSGWDNSIEWIVARSTREVSAGVATGSRVSLRLEAALPMLGSDYDYWYATVSADRAFRIGAAQNLVLKGLAAIGQDIPFQQELASGGTTMRGYKNYQFRGDLKALTNVEYSAPLFSVRGLSFRGQAFWDASYVTFQAADEAATGRHYLPGARATGWAPLKNSIGLGVRVHLRQIVLPLLGIDFGYGLERDGFELYLAVGISD